MNRRTMIWIVSILVGLLVSGATDWLRTPGGSFGLGERGGSPAGSALAASDDEPPSPYIAPYVPTPQEVVDRMLELAEIRDGDVVYDLGSGDGRIVITAAARYGVKAVGFEINPDLVATARANVKAAGLEHLVEIREEDILDVDLSPASVVTLYLYPGANLRLRSVIMSRLEPGSRVVSHQFAMGSWKPDRVERIMDSAGTVRTLYLWRIRPRN